ncbi:MAG: hypothetical protein L0Z62_33690 [Gemmataceae bacterium]|nr:hypothetical protein [Gemmataceae bacterium]
MRRTRWLVCAGAVLALAGGCASGPLLDNPAFVAPAAAECNPMYVGLGPTQTSYRKVFEGAVAALTDYGFEILETNTFDGRIETLPRIAPGLLRPFMSGSHDPYGRLLATFQTYRHRAQVLIQPAPTGGPGGYWVRVTVFRELEDLPRPVRSTQGAANFRTDNNVERTVEVIDPTVFEANWVPRGRDVEVEQQLLARLKRCL